MSNHLTLAMPQLTLVMPQLTLVMPQLTLVMPQLTLAMLHLHIIAQLQSTTLMLQPLTDQPYTDPDYGTDKPEFELNYL